MPWSGEIVGMYLIREPAFLVFYGNSPLLDLINLITALYLIVFIIQLFYNLGAVIYAYDHGCAVYHFVLHQRIAVNELIGAVLVEKSVFVEFRCEETSQERC